MVGEYLSSHSLTLGTCKKNEESVAGLGRVLAGRWCSAGVPCAREAPMGAKAALKLWV